MKKSKLITLLQNELIAANVRVDRIRDELADQIMQNDELKQRMAAATKIVESAMADPKLAKTHCECIAFAHDILTWNMT